MDNTKKKGTIITSRKYDNSSRFILMCESARRCLSTDDCENVIQGDYPPCEAIARHIISLAYAKYDTVFGFGNEVDRFVTFMLFEENTTIDQIAFICAMKVVYGKEWNGKEFVDEIDKVFGENEMSQPCKEFCTTVETELYRTANDPTLTEAGLRLHVRAIAKDVQKYEDHELN